MLFPSLPPPERLVPIVDIVATNNGCTCLEHCFGCGNVLLLGRAGHGCGVLLRLWMTAPNELAAYMVSDDGSDGCRVGFAPREHTVGVRGHSLDGALVRLLEVYTPEHPNSHCIALYHRNCGYVISEIVD